MPDQADNLRQLFHVAVPTPQAFVSGSRTIVVAGGRAGVGATTIAINLAAVLADRGMRVLVVDAAAERSNLAEMSGVRRDALEHTLSDALSGRCTVEDAIRLGPGGTMLLVNRGGRREEGFSRQAQQRLLNELDSLRGEFDYFIVDLGSELTPWAKRFWLQAQLVLLVTTTETAAVIDSYSTIKRSVADETGPDVRLVVNKCSSDITVGEVHRRLSNACDRFLGRRLPLLSSLPAYEVEHATERTPPVWEAPDTPFGHGMLWLCRAVSEVLSTNQREVGRCITC